jgi:hypothetical protein
MRSLATFLIPSLLVVTASEAAAKAHPHRYHQRYVDHRQWHNAPYLRAEHADGWYDHESNKLPFGSALWWQQMEREGRAGNTRR